MGVGLHTGHYRLDFMGGKRLSLDSGSLDTTTE